MDDISANHITVWDGTHSIWQADETFYVGGRFSLLPEIFPEQNYKNPKNYHQCNYCRRCSEGYVCDGCGAPLIFDVNQS